MIRSVLTLSIFMFIGIAVFLYDNTAIAQVMQSPSYQVQFDSVNFTGGLSTSSNYTLESTGGEIATGESSSANYGLHAGYQQMNEVYIALSAPQSVVMSPPIPGLSGGVANGSTTVTVTTDSPAGYQLTIKSSRAPAMQKGGDSIADYASGAVPDYSFAVGAGQAFFGYTSEGDDVVSRFLDDGSTCGSGSQTPLSCWDGLSTSAAVIAEGADANHPAGATTTIRFRVGVGSGVGQAPGVYTATTTLTALPL